MSLSPHEQFLAAITRAERPLIVLADDAHVDLFASAFGVRAYLLSLGKTADIACAGSRVPDTLSFLPNFAPTAGDLPNIRSLILHVNTEKITMNELSYATEGDDLRIHILPKNGAWNANDVRIEAGAYRYDLVLALGAPSFAHLGALYANYADFFHRTNVIAIDTNPDNEHFGAVNIVDAGAVSVGEICFDVIEHIDANAVTPDMATCFFASMVARTRSFKSGNVSPRTLATAASLMKKGARRDEIVKRLYRTRSLETLRLWGRALARLKHDAERGIVWTLLTRQDFLHADAEQGSLNDIVDELREMSPESRVIVIFIEQENDTVSVRLFAQRPLDALALGAPFKASGTRESAHLTVNEKDIVVAERAVIEHIRATITKSQGR